MILANNDELVVILYSVIGLTSPAFQAFSRMAGSFLTKRKGLIGTCVYIANLIAPTPGFHVSCSQAHLILSSIGAKKWQQNLKLLENFPID